ncbi:MAG: hypothetical protein M3Y81_28145 [Chloroflexota bacterium]|nr:hypothetical protein [Chloroflexota bacterium]
MPEQETKVRVPMATPRSLTEDTYKHLWLLRYRQYLGQLTFLELLDKYEEILGIAPRRESEQ